MEKIQSWLVSKKNYVIAIFRIFYAVLVFFMVVGGYSVLKQKPDMMTYVERGLQMGQFAVYFFIITLSPGIARRFGIKHTIFTIIMLFRRQFGVSVFLLALAHYIVVRFMFYFNGIAPFSFYPALFEVFGMISLALLTPLFLTSNSTSVAKLGPWWKRIHSLVYIVIWTVFIHVAIQNPFDTYSILLGITAVLELSSLLYYSAIQKRQIPTT